MVKLKNRELVTFGTKAYELYSSFFIKVSFAIVFIKTLILVGFL